MKKLLLSLFLAASCLSAFAQLSANEVAKLYFVEAEKRFNQNEYATALEYIEKAENELGETNGRILSLKVKTLYNSGAFQSAQTALNQFINHYASTVTPEIKDETMSYFIKLERYFEKRNEEQTRRAEAARKRDESLKYYRYVTCGNSRCGGGLVKEEYNETCYNCDGTGQTTEYDYAQAFANGFNGTNKPTSYKVTCKSCNGYRKVRRSRMVNCGTCKGSGKVLSYYGATAYSQADIDYAIRTDKAKIDYYINLRAEIAKNSSRNIFALKDFDSGLYGLCNRSLRLVVPPRYEKVDVITDDLAIVTSGSLSGIVNSKNDMVFPQEYEWIRKLSETSLLVGKASKHYMVDYNGKPKGPTVDSYYAYGKHLVVFKDDARYGVMDFNGRIVKEATFDNVKRFSWSPFLVAFRANNQWRLYDLTTSVKDLFGESFTEIRQHKHNGKEVYVLINGTSKIATPGTLVSDAAFDEVTFHEKLGLLSIRKGALYGFYDISGGKLTPPKYDGLYVNNNNPGRALVIKNGLYGIVDSHDKPVIPLEKVKIWFNSQKPGFVTQEKEKSKKRLVYDSNGNFLYDYKDN